MIYDSNDAEKRAIMQVADLMLAAAKTAPKGCGADNLQTLIIDGAHKKRLVEEMRKIAKEPKLGFFERDANNIDGSVCVVLIGTHNKPIGLPGCSLCGFEDCGKTAKAGANCAFNITDLGIAIGSAVSVAANHRIDNRVLFSAGKAAIRIHCFDEDVKVCYGIPLLVSSKSIFFDRGDTYAAKNA